MKKLSLLFLFAFVIATLASPLLNSKVSASSLPEGDNVSKTLGFTTTGEDAFYKFRVDGGGMSCEGKIRYYLRDGRQITTIKATGDQCYAVSMKVDYGSGYSPWANAYNGDFVSLDVEGTIRIENILYRLCSIPAGSSAAVCTKVHRTRYFTPPYWTLSRCYDQKPLISTTTRQNHKCVKYIQDALRQDGYRPGPVDGVYGPNTEAAVKRFQADPQHSPVLAADGIFGPQTWSKFINAYGLFTE